MKFHRGKKHAPQEGIEPKPQISSIIKQKNVKLLKISKEYSNPDNGCSVAKRGEIEKKKSSLNFTPAFCPKKMPSLILSENVIV